MSILPENDTWGYTVSDHYDYIEGKAAYHGGNLLQGIEDYLQEKPEYEFFREGFLQYAKEKHIELFGRAIHRIYTGQYVMAFVTLENAFDVLNISLEKKEIFHKLEEGAKLFDIELDIDKLESEYVRFLKQKNLFRS